MAISTFLSTLEPGRREVLSAMHEIMLTTDRTVEASIGTMMGKQMILYNANGVFKYGLASVKNYMSLHIMPIYGSPELYNRYIALLPKANFQKGCINFRNQDEIPLPVYKEMIADCEKVDLSAIREKYLQDKKAAKKSGASAGLGRKPRS